MFDNYSKNREFSELSYFTFVRVFIQNLIFRYQQSCEFKPLIKKPLFSGHNFNLKNHRYSKATKNHGNKFGPLKLGDSGGLVVAQLGH